MASSCRHGVDGGLRADHLHVAVLQRLSHLGVVDEAEHQVLGAGRGAPVGGIGLKGERGVSDPAVRLHLVGTGRRGDLVEVLRQFTGAVQPALVPEVGDLLDGLGIAIEDRLRQRVGLEAGLLRSHMGRQRSGHEQLVIGVLVLEHDGELLGAQLALRALGSIPGEGVGDVIEDRHGFLVLTIGVPGHQPLGVLGRPIEKEVVDGDRGAIGPDRSVIDGVLDGQRILADDLKGTEILVLADGAVHAEVDETGEHAITDDAVVGGVGLEQHGVVAAPVARAGGVADLTLSGLRDADILNARVTGIGRRRVRIGGLVRRGGGGRRGAGIVTGLCIRGAGAQCKCTAQQHRERRNASLELH